MNVYEHNICFIFFYFSLISSEKIGHNSHSHLLRWSQPPTLNYETKRSFCFYLTQNMYRSFFEEWMWINQSLCFFLTALAEAWGRGLMLEISSQRGEQMFDIFTTCGGETGASTVSSHLSRSAVTPGGFPDQDINISHNISSAASLLLK